MHNRLIRVTLVGLAAVLAAGVMYFIVDLERRTQAVREAQETIGEQTDVALSSIAGLQSGQRGYVAVGQGTEFWVDQVAESQRVLETTLDLLRATLVAEPSLAALDAAGTALENFARVDDRAIDFVNRDQPLLASNLIFSDGLETTATAAAQIRAVRAEESGARALQLQQFRQQQAWSAAGGGALLLLLAVVLLPASRLADAARPGVAGETAGTADDADPKHEPGETAAGVGLPPLVLESTARLCTELGRVVEPTELSPLLARAAAVLEASELVVWLRELAPEDQAPAPSSGHLRPAGRLRPALTHGYSTQRLARLEALPGDADNVAAEAYRAGHAKIVAGGLAVPLLTPAGCNGVLAAEFGSGAERRESTQALAAILAAQLATLLGPVAAAPASTTAESMSGPRAGEDGARDQRRAAQGS